MPSIHLLASLFLAALAASAFTCASRAEASELTDAIILGDPASEAAHALAADHAEVIQGGLGEPARRLLPLDPANWKGGRLELTLKVDPNRQNYVTIRLWGDDITGDRLILYCEGKQIGYRHLGDVDILDFGSEGRGYPGRFFYNTSPLPLEMTRGKTEMNFEVRSTGRIWAYGNSFEQYQKPMTDPTRGIYALYTHTQGYFVPPAGEKQGTAPASLPVRGEPGPEVLDQVKARVNEQINHLLTMPAPPDQLQMHLLAKAYFVKSTPAFHNPKAPQRVAQGCDALYAAYLRNPKIAQADPAVYNAEWFGLGMMGDSLRLLAGPLAPLLDQKAGGETDISRRAAWSRMLQESRDWHRAHRRIYTNQSMIIDMNIYRCNRGIAAIDPAHAMPEKSALRYLYEAVGLQPWLGSDTEQGPEKPAGDHYFQLTAKGLTKELGYVGNYGEVLDWVTQIYDATRDPGQPGNEKIRERIAKIVHARSFFRYPSEDDEGNRAMRIEAVVGWRDAHYPGDVAYGERASWDASTLYTAAATLDPESVGYAQQMFADNQFFSSLKERMKDRGLRVTIGLLGAPEQYELIRAQKPSFIRLPMTPGQPDFVWADEEDGVLAIKHGKEIIYLSLYWRARFAINFLARVHDIEPNFSRIAVVPEETEFEPSGLTYVRPDWTDFGFANGGHKYPGNPHSALAGEKLPIARIPSDEQFKPGKESPFAGRGSFYHLQYGKYLIGMNATSDKTFELSLPASQQRAVDLATEKVLDASTVKVGPESTVVLWLGQ